MKTRKILLILATALATVLAMFGLAACEQSDEEYHEHVYGAWTVTQEPTCVDQGSKECVCEECGIVITRSIPALGHTEVVMEGKSPSCTEAGLTEGRMCSVCHTVLVEQKVIPLTAHNEELAEWKESTCVQNGYVVYRCKDCGVEHSEVLPLAEHKFDDGVVTTLPSCTATGVKKRVCSECGYVKTEVVPATGHTESTDGVITKEVTCTENGVKTFYCQTCGEVVRTETIFTTGHSYDNGIVTTPPTCTTAGEKTYTCVVCGETKTEVILATGHTENAEGVVTTEATCTENGVKTFYCQTCGEVVKTETVLASGHNYDEGTVTTQPACEDTGVKTFTCVVCGETKTEVIAATGHTENTEGVITTAATCTENGVKTFYCQVCGEVARTAVVPATGHKYDEGTVTTAATCTESGIKSFTCSICYEVSTEVIPATGHTEIPIGEAKDSTCEKEGYTAGVKCQTCGEILEEQTILPLAEHDYVNSICSMCGLEKVYTVRFYIFGELFDEQTYKMSDKSIVEPSIPEKEGYSVEGWENYALTGDISVNAVYKPVTYVITLNPGNGLLSVKTYDVTYNTSYELPIPVYEKYIFVGWFSSASSNAIQYTDSKGKCLAPYDYPGNKIYYAQWSAPKVDVTLDFDNGQSAKVITLTYGTAFDLEGIVNEPTKEGALFDGWFTESGEEYTFSTIIRQAVTLKAKWTESKAVSTVEELFAIADDPTLNYHLTKDITLPNSNKVWTAIDNFSGILNGNGYTITNISLTLGDNSCYGFVRTNNGTIENLSFSRVSFAQKITSGGDTHSGIVAATNNGTIKNCHLLSGTVSYTIEVNTIGASYYLGALVGYNSGSIYDCSAKIDSTVSIACHAKNASKSSYLYIGGLVGVNSGTLESVWADNTIVANCYAYGYSNYPINYQTNYLRLGGLVGENRKTIAECYSVTDISLTLGKNEKAVVYTGWGGFIGINTSGATIQKSFSNGAITLKGSANIINTGGFVGYNSGTSNIYNCYSTVDVTSNSGGNIGGFIGQNDGANISGSYSSGNVTATAGGTMGGFIGYCTNAGGSISNCYSCGDVITNSGTAGLFVGSSASAINDCYFMKDARLIYNGKPVDVSSELNGTIDGKYCYDIWSEAFLTEELFWTSEDGWIILTDEDPIFEWEIEVFHNYDTYVFEPTCDYYGYTLYICSDCTRFFVRNINEPLGHDFDYEHPVVKEATCTESGYKYYVCLREGCTEEHGKIYISETYDPLGHTAGEVVYGKAADGKDKTYDATCTEEGRATYICSVCGKEFSVIIPALGHDKYTSIEEVAVSCYYDAETEEYVMIDGWTAEILCKRCEVVLQEREVIEAHHYFEYDYTLEPTCTSYGAGTATCKMCGYIWISESFPMIDHVDENKDYRCDVCHTFLFSVTDEIPEEECVTITTLQGLKDIANNLNGIYVLGADITITDDWTPIGTEANPFTGRLYGNGKTITGLTLNCVEVGGLFGYNQGFISGITLNGINVTINNQDCVFGGIAAYNHGLIHSCTVTGSVNITVTTELETSEVKNNLKQYTETIGGIAGINERGGEITSCSSTATYSNTFNNTARTTFKTDYNWFQGVVNGIFNMDKVQYKSYTTRSLNVIYFGQICGYNTATLNTCSVTGTGRNTIGVKAETTHKAGTAVAKTVFWQSDNICGYNAGEYIGDMIYGIKFEYTLSYYYNGEKSESFYYKMEESIEYNAS
ncbi:MAG: GLUG motif-containing protein [Candidatus Coproplasma sp.]